MTGTIAGANEPAAASSFSFNLWDVPWITVLDSAGGARRLGIHDCLVEAHLLRALVDSSPLVIAGLQRLLAAIVTDIYRPDSLVELADLIAQGRFDPEAIDRFGGAYQHRFDLFSAREPFMQSGDIPITLPGKKGSTKTVGYLFPDVPTATNINHFDHRFDDQEQYTPATAALGLVTIPAFASSGGAGIKPSINGVPPLYVLPTGDTLFQTLALSIITPGFQPSAADVYEPDLPAWTRERAVERGRELTNVGYLESLTFPARRVRLFPEQVTGVCSRSGELSDVLVRRMTFEMGHSRDKTAAFWFDPFAAYRLRKDDVPVPIRPVEGKALWREYANLFQMVERSGSSEVERGAVVMPNVVAQTVVLMEKSTEPIDPGRRWRFRCIGLRTDMKAKVFEWRDETLDVPAGILADDSGELDVSSAIQRAEEWANKIRGLHQDVYGEGRDRFHAIRERMRRNYWTRLAEPFRRYIDAAARPNGRAEALSDWTEQLFRVGEEVLAEASDDAGWRGDRLRQAAELMHQYRLARGKKRKELNR